MDNNLYRLAAKEDYLFKSLRGMITTSDLFDLPLEGNNNMNLDCIAQSINSDIEQDGKQSFVRVNTVNPTNANKLEIVKDIIAEKIATTVAIKKAASNKIKKDRILKILASKENSIMEQRTEADLLAELKELS